MSDPRRWLEDASRRDDDARRLLQAGKGLAPPSGAVDRGWAEFLALSKISDPSGGDSGGGPIGAGDGGGTAELAGSGAAALAKAGVSGVAVAKSLVLGAALGVGSALGMHQLAGETEPLPPASSTNVRAAPRTAGVPRELTAPVPALPPEDGSPSAAPPESALVGRELDRHAVSPVPSVADFARDESVASFPIDAATAENSLKAEALVLARSKALLAEGRPGAALALLRETNARYAGGALGEEREAVVVEALARSGDAGGARRAAIAFLSRHPRSPLVSRMKSYAGE